MKLQRLCFYTYLSVILFTRGSTLAGTPWTRYTPWAGTPPRTRYIPTRPGAPLGWVHPPRPGTPPGRYIHLGPGTPLAGTPTPLGRYTPQSWYTPGTRSPPGQVHLPFPPPPPGQVPGTRYTPPADGYCCGQYASYWNAFLFCNGIC